MTDTMTRQEFTEYMTAFEQRLDARFGRIDGRLDGIDGRLAQHDRRFDVLDQRLGQHDARFVRIETSLAELHKNMTMQFEETRREFKLSLEAVNVVQEATERGFEDMRREHALQTSLLESAVGHVRRRVDSVEPRDRT